MVLADESEKTVSGLHELYTNLAPVGSFKKRPYAPRGHLEDKIKPYLIPLGLTGARVHVLPRINNSPPLLSSGADV
jgi:hypothetical protein